MSHTFLKVLVMVHNAVSLKHGKDPVWKKFAYPHFNNHGINVRVFFPQMEYMFFDISRYQFLYGIKLYTFVTYSYMKHFI